MAQDARITLIVDGRLLRDDGGIFTTLRENMEALMEDASGLAAAIDDFRASIQGLLTQVEELLTQPEPDLVAAIDALHDMQVAVDLEAEKVREKLHPDEPPPAV